MSASIHQLFPDQLDQTAVRSARPNQPQPSDGDGDGPIRIKIILDVEEPPEDPEPVEKKKDTKSFWFGVLVGWLIGG